MSGYRRLTLAEAVSAGRVALEAAGIESTWAVAEVTLPDDVDVVLAFAVREAITNVIRHSRARRCWVRVTSGLVEATAEIVDDGAGYLGETGASPAPSSVDAAKAAQWAGNGLTGLGERVAALHGRLEVAPRPEGGFRLRASIPTAASLADLSG